MLESNPRRRAMRVDVAEAREAIAALTPINEQIGHWQARSACLMAQAERLRAAGAFHPALADEAEALMRTVAVQQERFVEAARNLPPAVAANTRVRDTANALKSLAESLDAVQSLLGGPSAMASAGRH